MGLKDDLQKEVADIYRTKWSNRKGQVVPEAEDIKLGNDAVAFDEAVVLYADLAASTELVNRFPDWFAAEVYKSYLHCASKIIRAFNGEITAFDGDRVMAVYLGGYKRTNAAKTALQINSAVRDIINPAIKKQFPSTDYNVRQVVGIDVSKLFIARTGIRGSNDLVWVGRAANYAAKLCSLREDGFSSYITEDVYDTLNEEAKLGGEPKRSMWEKRFWTARSINVYRSNWWWSV
jgi:class 3 adenylate cyclase